VIPVEQRFSFDCMTACIASIFECSWEDAPLLCDPDTNEPVDQWLREMTLWMRAHGMNPWHFGIWGDEKPYLKFGSSEIRYVFRPPCYWLGGVKSSRYDGEHCVVMYADEVLWDPHPQREMGHLGFTTAEVIVPWQEVPLPELGRRIKGAAAP